MKYRTVLLPFTKKFIAVNFSFFCCSFLFVICFLSLGIFSSGCFIIRPIAGANIDTEQLKKAREAKVLEVRHEGAQQLLTRLRNNDPIDNADLIFYFSEALLNKTAAQVDSTSGWLDSVTSYYVRSIRIKLYNGSAIATIAMAAYNHDYDVDVDLLMDCLLTFSIDSGKFYARLEPFNIVPTVKATGVIVSMENIVQDILTIKLSTLNDYLPPIQFPVDFNNQFPVQGSAVTVRAGINLNVSTPPRMIGYNLALKEVLLFKEKLLVALNVRKGSSEK